MVEALLNQLSAELAAVRAALNEVHAQAQVTGKVIHDVKDNVAIVKGAVTPVKVERLEYSLHVSACHSSTGAEGAV